jgi:Mitochondrial carrier protein
MLPLRYLGVLHTLGLTYREEGLKGLYRGYLAYLVAVSLIITIIMHTGFIYHHGGAHLSRADHA